MKYFSQVFTDMMRLYVGTNSESFHEYKDFFHVRSFFNSQWYNFVIPKLLNPEELDIKVIGRVIAKEKKEGKQVSLYINQELLDNYKSFLETNKCKLYGDEIYLLKTLDSAQKLVLPDGYSVGSDYNLDDVIGTLEKCFPEWPEEAVYSKTYEAYKVKGQEGRLFETMVVKSGKSTIGAGSVSLDLNLNLGYLHNAGILESHRRKGLHTNLVDARCNFCLENGITRVVSIVDEKANSYVSLLKNGFTVADKFFVFSNN